MRIILIGVLVVAAGLPCAGLEVNLLEVDLSVDPGQLHTFTFIVRNETEVSEMFTVYVGDWDRDELGGNRFYPPGSTARSLAPWLAMAPAAFALGPGETREIKGALAVPASIGAGTYWGIVFIHGEPRPVDHGGTTVLVAKRIGVKVYASVGAARPEGEVRRLEFRGLNPFWLVAQFRNAGLTNLRDVRVEVQVYDSKGDLLTRVEPDPVPCLPGGERWVQVDTGLRLKPGTYLVVARVDPGGDEIIAAQASLRVREFTLFPVAGDQVSRDLDGDGLYEDIDGNGVLDEDDVDLFRAQWASAPIQGNARAFDFDNSGRVDERDVEALADLLKSRSP